MIALILASYSTACAIKIDYEGSAVQWEPAPEPRKEDSGGAVYNGNGGMVIGGGGDVVNGDGPKS